MLVVLWGGALWLGTHLVVVNRVEVPSPVLASTLAGRRLLHLSDLHVRRVGWRERRLVAIAARARPDLILVTGDLVEPSAGLDASVAGALDVMTRLAALAPTVAILGNNDLPATHPAGGPPLPDRLSAAGVVLLRNAAARVEARAGPPGAATYVVGLDDNYLHRDDLVAATRGVPDGAPAILLAHSPDVVRDWDLSRFALVLAGHTHGGQIRLPLVGALETQTRTSYVRGRYALPGGAFLHVSGGVGTSEVDLRFLAQPSITLLEVTTGVTGTPR